MAETHEVTAPFHQQFFCALHETYGDRAVNEIGGVVLFLTDQAGIEFDAHSQLPLQERDAAECARRYALLESGRSESLPWNSVMTLGTIAVLAGELASLDVIANNRPFKIMGPTSQLASVAFFHDALHLSLDRRVADEFFNRLSVPQLQPPLARTGG